MTTRGIVRLSMIGLVSMLALWLVAGCAGPGQEEGPTPVAGSFVGAVSDPVASVAVVAGEPAQAEESREVRALIYGEIENPINEWFVGSAEGNTLQLASDSGAEFEGELTPDGAAGTITLPDETSVPFDAVPATGWAGLYEVTISPDGLVNGTSASGARLEGQLEEERASQGETRGPGIVPLTGTLTAPDGETRPFVMDLLGALPPNAFEEQPAQARFIVLPNGPIRGGAKTPTPSFQVRDNY